MNPPQQQSSLPPSPRIIVAGAVCSTRRIFQGLLRNRANVVGVLGLSRKASARVSGYARLDDLAAEAGIPYQDFTRINDEEVVQTAHGWRPDLLFIVGLSQIVRQEVLAIPQVGCVGFHPTWLPEGRGRAPVAWLTLESRPGAASFFLMDEGVDSGPLLVQEPFFVSPGDYAEDVTAKLLDAVDRALDRWVPRLLAGQWNPQPQADHRATLYGRRAPEDGLIDWSQPAEMIYGLIRAASRPHPGAYTYASGRRLIVWRAEPEKAWAFRGVPGRILHAEDGRGPLVQTGEGLLWLTEVEDESTRGCPPCR